MKKKLQDRCKAKFLSLTDREEEYLRSISFPRKLLKGARQEADSIKDDRADILAKDFVKDTSGKVETINREQVASFTHFAVAAECFGGLLKDHYEKVKEERNPSGTTFTLQTPISPRCFLPKKLPEFSQGKLEQLYVALSAVKDARRKKHSDKEVTLHAELERKFFHYLFGRQFESDKSNIRRQEFFTYHLLESFSLVPHTFTYNE